MKKQLEINSGQIFKHWQIIKEIEKKSGRRYFLCECMLCNNNYNVRIDSLVTKNSHFSCTSCTASNRYTINADNLIGKVFGRLTVISKHSVSKHSQWQYLCQCSCGIQKIIDRNSLITKNTISCGCYKTEISKNKGQTRISNLSPFWKGGISSQNEITRTKIETAVNPLIRKRDNYCCQNCGNNKSGNLNVHHIFNFAKYPELRYELYNLVVLCVNCHKEYHKIYGRKNNTLEQFETFIQTKYKYHEELLTHYNYYL